MPGLLVSILVKENQVVDENQPLAIVEAMKMENIIKSEKKNKNKNNKQRDSLEVDQIIVLNKLSGRGGIVDATLRAL